MRISTIILAVLMIGISVPALAQERAAPVRSEEIWTSFSITGRPPKFFNDIIGKEIRKRFRLDGEIGYRTADTFFAGRQLYLNGSIRYELSELISIGAEHRYSYRPGRENRQRTQGVVYLSRTMGRLDLGLRSIYQHNYDRPVGDKDLIRNRIAAEYDVPKWKLDPEFSVEFFTAMEIDGANYIGTRYKLGTTWSPWKGHDLSVALLHDRERNVAWPEHRWIISLEYGLNVRKM